MRVHHFSHLFAFIPFLHPSLLSVWLSSFCLSAAVHVVICSKPVIICLIWLPLLPLWLWLCSRFVNVCLIYENRPGRKYWRWLNTNDTDVSTTDLLQSLKNTSWYVANYTCHIPALENFFFYVCSLELSNIFDQFQHNSYSSSFSSHASIQIICIISGQGSWMMQRQESCTCSVQDLTVCVPTLVIFQCFVLSVDVLSQCWIKLASFNISGFLYIC